MWSTSNLKDTQSEFLEPLTTRVQDLKEDYIQRLAKVEMEQDADFMDGVQQGGGAPIAEGKIRSKNGVVNFDIDMDDEDDYDSDDDDGLKGPPKDTVLELNQSMMKLELMDELLERIQELTSSALVEEEEDDD